MNESTNIGGSVDSNIGNTNIDDNVDSNIGDLVEPQENKEQVVNHEEDVLIDNSTTFLELLKVLRDCPAALEAEKDEKEQKIEEAKEEELRAVLGEDFDEKTDTFVKADRRPGPIQLWNTYHRIAHKEMSEGGYCDVYENGYAVFDDGNRRTVVWVPDCGSTNYFFAPLRANEKEYLEQNRTVEMDVYGPAEWYIAVMVAGMDSITRNLEHPKSKGNTSESEKDDLDIKPDYKLRMSYHIETPEEVLIRRENELERRAALTEQQRMAYELYYGQGFGLKEVSAVMGTSHQNVSKLLKNARTTVREIIKKNI